MRNERKTGWMKNEKYIQILVMCSGPLADVLFKNRMLGDYGYQYFLEFWWRPRRWWVNNQICTQWCHRLHLGQFQSSLQRNPSVGMGAALHSVTQYVSSCVLFLFRCFVCCFRSVPQKQLIPKTTTQHLKTSEWHLWRHCCQRNSIVCWFSFVLRQCKDTSFCQPRDIFYLIIFICELPLWVKPHV